MIGRIDAFLLRVRRFLSRSEWLARLLRLPASEGSPTRPGLIIVQIDGLSRTQLEKALANNELPFLRRLLDNEHYRLHTLYCGLPSTTPAVQAELFYGVRGAVPAFSFRSKQSGRIVRMYEPRSAAKVEEELARIAGKGLLEGGSSYSDIYTGSAAESHFCLPSMGWGHSLRNANPLVLFAFLLANLFSFLRVGALLVLELGLAVIDFVRGVINEFDPVKELKFVPTRVAITILLRELCIIGGKIDLARGLPVVHINLLGYDEQAHRRGPASRFAHWSLKGIDDAIARLWRAAHRSRWRHYDLWVHSDHGQAALDVYERVQGYKLREAVDRAFSEAVSKPAAAAADTAGSIQTHRVRLLGAQRLRWLFPVAGAVRHAEEDERPVLTAMGPVGHLYFPRSTTADERARIARSLTTEHGVPVAVAVEARRRLRGFSGIGEFSLPADTAGLFGADHPFLDELGADLVRLCEHPDAGDLVLLGWRAGIRGVTFAVENGSHGGPSPDETRAFALLPKDAPLVRSACGYLRPGDLRTAAMHHLARTTSGRHARRRRPDVLRIVTYNVHGCVGIDGKLDAARIARVIARTRPDVVALQELDVGRPRSDHVDQARHIARLLKMESHFHPAMHLEGERYGDAILSRLPQRLVRADLLPGHAKSPGSEPRGALWVAVELDGNEIQIINTHLGLNARERRMQTDTLLGPKWLGHPACTDPMILCGDLNAGPASDVHKRLSTRLADIQLAAVNHRPRRTFPGRLPAVRIDHIFIGPGLAADRVTIPDSRLARVASDHLPLIADVRLLSAIDTGDTAASQTPDARQCRQHQ